MQGEVLEERPAAPPPVREPPRQDRTQPTDPATEDDFLNRLVHSRDRLVQGEAIKHEH